MVDMLSFSRPMSLIATEEIQAKDAWNAMLREQVAQLQAWKDAVPVTQIERYICDGYGDDDATSDGDWRVILAWLDSMADADNEVTCG